MNRPKFDEATILSVAKTTLANARTAASAFDEFGITAEKLNEFEADIQRAEALPGEMQERVELRDLTSSKDDALEACYAWGWKLRMRLELAFGRNSTEAKSFPARAFKQAKYSEAAMMPVMNMLLALAGKYQADLAEFGLTDDVLAAGNRLYEDLLTTDAVQELGKDNKRKATKTRYLLFRRIYDMTNKINQIGRMMFRDNPVELTLFQSKWPRAGARAEAEAEEPAEEAIPA